jgi:hypothetical protein
LFHVSQDTESILREGFRDNSGDYGFRDDSGDVRELAGVFVSDQPVGIEEAEGDVLVATVPEDADLSAYAIVEPDAPPGWRHEWRIPAETLNQWPVQRYEWPDEGVIEYPDS